jgi:hypothetical protein
MLESSIPNDAGGGGVYKKKPVGSLGSDNFTKKDLSFIYSKFFPTTG